MIKLKTQVSIYFKNRINNVKHIVIKSSGLSSIHFDSKIANVIVSDNKEEVLNFLFKLLKRGAEIEVIKSNVTANF